MKRIAYWGLKGIGYSVCSPDSAIYDLWFGSEKEMIQFAAEMGWKLRRA